MEPALKIGNLDIHFRAIPAPLASITDIVFRKLLDEIGYTGYMVTEMISAEGLRRLQSKTLYMIRPSEFKTPQFIQLFGSTPQAFTDAVKYVDSETGFHGIDINMGCPAGKVIRKGGGSALLANPLNAAAIIRETKNNTRLPVTVKLRLGFKKENILEMVKVAEGEGVDAIAVHFRLQSDGYTGEAKWHYAQLIKERLNKGTVFIGNGDIKTAGEAREKLKVVDGVMIGRGAVINPYIFPEIAGVDPASLDMNRLFIRILELIEENSIPKLWLPRLKAYGRYLFSNRPNSKRIRQHIYTCNTFEDAKQFLTSLKEENHEAL